MLVLKLRRDDDAVAILLTVKLQGIFGSNFFYQAVTYTMMKPVN